MRRRVGLVGAALVLLDACPAVAQLNDDDQVHRLRTRFGVGFVSGIAEVPYASLETDPALIGIAVRVGVQITDRFAVLDQISFTAIWLQIRNAVLFEWTPSDYLSVAAGPEIEWLADIGGSADADGAVGGTLRLALNAPYSRGPHGRRRAVSFSVEVTPSYTFANNTNVQLPNGFQLGVMGGIGIDFY